MKGQAHRFVTALLIPPVVYVTYTYTGSHILAAAAGMGTLANMVLSPDLDLAENPKNALHYLFFFYGRAIHHRSFWSHFPVAGTVGRILYLCFLAWPIWLFIGRPTISIDAGIALSAFFGLVVADTAHWICDFLVHDNRSKNGKVRARPKSSRSEDNAGNRKAFGCQDTEYVHS